MLDAWHAILAFLSGPFGQIVLTAASAFLVSRFPWAKAVIDALIGLFHQQVVNNAFERVQHDRTAPFNSTGEAVNATIMAALPKLPPGVPEDDLRTMAIAAVNGPQTSQVRLRATI